MTANPVLVVGNDFDPATRYEGAVTVAGLLPNAALRTLYGWGHASLFPWQCVDQAVSAYLLMGTPPPDGSECDQDLVPFLDFGAASAAALGSSTGRAKVVPMMVPEVVRQSVR